jgi:Asp-tRNA(Asn)/Glu-tRNA(Gln) amidotransferase A subunit family amidase
LRPASFCGVVGFKPAFGWMTRGGMLPLARSLDTVGLIGRSVGVVADVYDALAGGATSNSERETGSPARLGVWHDALELAQPEIREAVAAVLRTIGESGVEVGATDAGVSYTDLRAMHQIIMLSEAAAAHSRLVRMYPGDYAPGIRAFVQTGAAIPAHVFIRAIALRDQYRETLSGRWNRFDAIVLPTADTAAPTRETTGNPALQAVATMLGYPSISLPIGLDSRGLPIGIQFIAPRRDGASRLLAVSHWLEALLPQLPPPPAVAAG